MSSEWTKAFTTIAKQIGKLQKSPMKVFMDRTTNYSQGWTDWNHSIYLLYQLII